MELKRILARDSRTANEKAIQLYGPEVLIISTQRVDQQTELIVAVDVAADTGVQGMAKSQSADGLSASQNAEGFVPFSKVFENVQTPEAMTSATQPASDLLADFDVPVFQMRLSDTSQDDKPAAPLAVAVPVSAQNTMVTTDVPAAPYEQQRSQEIVELLRQEMAALRKEFAVSRHMQPWQQTLTLSAEMQQLSAAMVEVGMPAGLRALLTDSIQGLQTLDEALPVIHGLLVDALKRPAKPMPGKGIHVLCGPSGAGKTSMVGRLAYAAAQTHGAEKQVMISFADQRPGAWSQIQVLAAQAGVACYRAADVSTLDALLDDLHGKTVWIDTPGIDFEVQAQHLMQQKHAMALHAVLPVDATVTSVQKIVQKNDIRWTSLMLTKMDEAAYPWPLLKSLCDQSMPVSCVAQDPQISVSPVAFDAQRLVSLAMAPLLSLLSVPEAQSRSAAPAMPIKPAKKTVRKPRAVQQAIVAPVKAAAAAVSRSRSVKTVRTAKAA